MTAWDRRALMGAGAAATLAAGARPAHASAPLKEGFALDRLARINHLLARGAAQQTFAGAVWRVNRKGREVASGVVGLADLKSATPMQADSIFRIFSLTKLVTVVAALSFYEEGAFDLHDPIEKWLPEFAAPKVQIPATSKDAAPTLRPAIRPITVLDLMRHTAGLSYAGPVDDKGASLYSQLGLDKPDRSLAEWVKVLASLPLVRDPGTGFDYGFGLDVVGRLIEIWGQAPLDQLFQSRIFGPLGMVATGFFVPPEKAARVTTLYSPSRLGQLLPDGTRDFGGPVFASPLPYQNLWRQDPKMKFGGAGLLSTLGDYSKFVEMLRQGGGLATRSGEVRILSPLTVALMHTDLLGNLPYRNGDIWSGYGFGLGVEVDHGPAEAANPLPAGAYDWGGAASTWIWIDPKEEVTALLWLQVIPSSPRWCQLFKEIVYGALLAPNG